MATNQTNAFANLPQRFSQTSQKAAEVVGHLVTMQQKSAVTTQVGVIVDISYQLTQGYVLCQLQSGIVRVFGVPYASAVAGMRVYCRKIGNVTLNQSYVFDGFASAVSSLGGSGSILFMQDYYNTLNGGSTYSNAIGSGATMTVFNGIPNMYFHCFFYLPALPAFAFSLFDFTPASASTTNYEDFNVTYETDGTITVAFGNTLFSGGSPLGACRTNKPVPPHSIHWITVQPGVPGSILVIDGKADYSVTSPFTTTLSGGSTLYSYTFMDVGQSGGNRPILAGSWIAKMGFGYSSLSGAVLPATTPQEDSDLIVQTDVFTSNFLYLCSEPSGSNFANSSDASATAPALRLSTGVSISATGPY